MAYSVKDLYLATSLNDLQQRAKTKKLETSSSKQIITSADKLFGEAEKALLEKNEELAYFYFFRYVDAISTAQKKEDYKKDKSYFDKLISRKKFKTAVESLEELTTSLERRYKLKKDAELHESRAKDKEYNEALENEKNLKNKKGGSGEVPSSGDATGKASLSTINGIVKTNGVDKVSVANAGIKPIELKNLLEQKTQRILLVDCRDLHDFTNNHIKHSNCICIPSTTLTQGMSANAILGALKDYPEFSTDWQKRGTFDCIILYDWNSSFDHRLQAMNIVYDALTKWDQDSKSTKIYVVQGGMKSMYYTYPSLLTNPHTGVNSASNKVNGSNTELDLRKLESISYPDLDDNSSSVVKPKSSEPKESNVNIINSDVPIAVNSSNRNINIYSSNSTHVHDVPKSGGGVGGIVPVDRSTKPVRYSSGQKIPNGTVSSEVTGAELNNSVEVSTNTEKTDLKVQEYSQALDEAIESAKDVVSKEKEVSDLVEKVGNQIQDENVRNKLQEKEVEAEKLKKLLEIRDDQLSKLKNEYLTYLREQKVKTYLPRIRTPPEEEEVKAKELEKIRLDEMVKSLRKLRVDEGERRAKEQAAAIVIGDAEKNQDDASRLPPIPQNSASGPLHKGNVIGTPVLPVINNVLPPSTATPSILKPGSGIGSTASPVSRPVSQDASGVTRVKLKDESSEPPRSSALKRSHSHPNIAQSHDEDMNNDLTASNQIPRINRGLKPTGNRNYAPEPITPIRRFARNFEVVSSTEKSKTGLKNLGNTCYMNSVIQCLAHTKKLVDYLCKEEYQKEWHPGRSPTQGEATVELAAAVKQMHSGHRSISLLDLKNTVGKHHRSFRGSEQQDSHEFITILLDWLHEEMNRVPQKVPLMEQKNDGLTDEVAAGRAWEDYRRSNDSKISELFCGQQKSCVTCVSCNRPSVTFEPFFILSVPIPSNGRKCDIQQCIDFYTTEEELVGWNCVHCKKKVRATKKIDLWRLPPYLIIHLQRFYFDGYWKKRLTEIDFPVENLNLNPKVLVSHGSYDYQLYGVSNHYGSMDGGHYTAYCRHLGAGNWWKYDDQEVCQLNSRDVSTPAAYILFYQNRNNNYA